MKRASALLLLTILISPPAFSQDNSKAYKWVDENGVVHYGDHVPPQYSKTERRVLNEHGVAVEIRPAEQTEEERIVEALLLEEEEIARRIREERIRRDRVLLASYRDVEDIEYVRDNRLSLLQAQVHVTERYMGDVQRRLDDLQERLAALQQEEREIPPWIQEDLGNAQAALRRHQATRARYMEDMELITARYDVDIRRFKQLMGYE